MKKKFSKESAFTLVEVMVAMLVLAIGLLGLAGITVVVLRSNTLSQQISDATTIATDLMERLKIQPMSNLGDCTGTYNTISPPSSSCSILTTSGLNSSALAGNYYPANFTANCAAQNVLGSNPNWVTFDVVTANLINPSTFSTADVCSSSVSIPQKNYLRFYRLLPSPTNSSDRIINVGVVWVDRFGRYRNVHFSTTRTAN